MKMTFEEAIDNHRKMWNWIADETEKRKRIVTKKDYFLENDYTSRPRNDCFCCEYATQVCFDYAVCDYCPLVWIERNSPSECTDAGSKYAAWAAYVNMYHEGYWRDDYTKKVAKLARQIANLPAKEKVEEDI